MLVSLDFVHIICKRREKCFFLWPNTLFVPRKGSKNSSDPFRQTVWMFRRESISFHFNFFPILFTPDTLKSYFPLNYQKCSHTFCGVIIQYNVEIDWTFFILCIYSIKNIHQGLKYTHARSGVALEYQYHFKMTTWATLKFSLYLQSSFNPQFTEIFKFEEDA